MPVSENRGKTCSAIHEYFDPEHKKANQFEIDVLLNAIHCASPEEQAAKFKEIRSHVDPIMVSTGTIAIAILSRDYKSTLISAAALFYLVKEKIFLTWGEFQQLLKERDKDYEDVYFYTLWEEYEKNMQDLKTKGLILDPYNPHYAGNPHYTDNPHHRGPLDPNFKPWS